MHIFSSKFQIFQWDDTALTLPEALLSPSEMPTVAIHTVKRGKKLSDFVLITWKGLE